MYVVSVAASQKGVTTARGRGGVGVEGWKREKERAMEVGGGVCLSEMSVGVPLKEYCLTDNTPGFAGIIRADFTVGVALSQTG